MTKGAGGVFSRRKMVATAWAGLLLSLLTGCSKPEPKLQPNRTDVPFVFVRLYPGYPGPKQVMRFGTIAALWPDGTLIRAVSEDQVGKSYIKGSITADQLSAVRKAIRKSGILAAIEGNIIIDARWVELTIRHERGVQSWAYSPGVQQNEAISMIKAELMALKLEKVETAEAEAYKGYPHDWYK